MGRSREDEPEIWKDTMVWRYQKWENLKERSSKNRLPITIKVQTYFLLNMFIIPAS